MLGELWRRIQYWRAGDAGSAGMDEEMRLHVAMRSEKLQSNGWSREEAAREARRRFGNQLHLRERSQDMWISRWFDDLVRDARFGLRALLRRPGFTATAVLTLAIGIGANTAVFSVLNSVLLKPLPYPEPEQVVSLSLQAPGAAGLANATGGLNLSASMFHTFSEQNRTLQSVGVWTSGRANVTGFAEPEQVRFAALSNGALQTFRVPPMLGRVFSLSDHTPGGPSTVILGHGYWQRRFGSNRSVIGQKLMVDGSLREIVGVMPEGFRVVAIEADVLFPLRFNRAQLRLPGFGLHGVARLRPGVDLARANADIGRLIPVWMYSWPAWPGIDPKVYEGFRITPALKPLKEEVVGSVGDVLWIVMGTIGVVMLIAGANVAGLLLVRAEGRSQELAIRGALGAGTARIMRELLVESALLGLAGGVVGLAGAVAAVRALVAAGPAMLPRLNEVSVDARAVWFTLVFSLGAGLMAGLLPALKYARARLLASIRSAGRTASVSRERSQTRNVLVVAQVALAVVLLISAGLMIRTFRALQTVDPGFTDPPTIQTVRISIPGSMNQVLRAQVDLVDNLRAIPGVESAAFTSELPMNSTSRNWDAVCIEGQKLRAMEIPPVRTYKVISPGLFQTMGTRLIAGRDLTPTDVMGKLPVALVSENMARELWGSAANAIGKRIGACAPSSHMKEVIGVVQDVHDNGVAKAAPSIVYWPPLVEGMYGPGDTSFSRNIDLVIRTRNAGGEGLIRQISQAVWSVNKNIPLASQQTMQDVLDRSMASTAFALVMLGIAGTMALLLGGIGIYGVISYAVSQRAREMGIRLALGARPGTLAVQFVRQSVVLASIGVTIGLLASAALTRLMSTLLFATNPLDPRTYAAVPAILLLAAVVASYLPARRVAAVNPVEALRADC